MATIYRVMVNGDERMRFRADLSQASAVIEVEGELGWVSTPFQTADARHDALTAAEILDRWLESQGGGAIASGEEYEVEEVR